MIALILGIGAGFAIIFLAAAWYLIAPFRQSLDRMYEE